jgi:hypothetical protein
MQIPARQANDLTARIKRLHGAHNARIKFISVPTPLLMDGDKVMSPNRTNYFPISQLMLATGVQRRIRQENIPWIVQFGDYKSLQDTEAWKQVLEPYGELRYGDRIFTKYIVGDGLGRMRHELEDADVIGITANFTFEANSVVKSIQAIRSVNDHAVILVGGRDASARADYFLKMGADIIALGDSDLVFPEFVSRLYHGKEIEDICQDGRLRSPAMRLRMNDLAFMNFDLLEGKLLRYNESGGGRFLPSIMDKGGVVYYETSRGCHRECDFCTERLTKRFEMDFDHFKREVLWYKENGVGTLMLSDDNILQRMHRPSGKDELIQMFEFLIEHGFTWEFPVGIEVGKLLRNGEGTVHEDLVDVMFWNNDHIDDYSGAFRSLIPFENMLGADDSSTTYRKMRTIEENHSILARLMRSGVPQINLAVMVGFQGETKESLERTRRGILEIMRLREEINDASSRNIKTFINYSLFVVTPFPGTPLYEQMRREGRLQYDIEVDPELWNLYTSVIRGDTFDAHRTTAHRQEMLELSQSYQAGGKVRLHMGDHGQLTV